MHQHATPVETLNPRSMASNALVPDEALTLWNGVKGRLSGWSGELFTDPFGELNLIIMPPDADDEIGPMLIIHKQHGLYVVDMFRWDEYGHVLSCLTLDDTMKTIESTVFAATSPRCAAPAIH